MEKRYTISNLTRPKADSRIRLLREIAQEGPIPRIDLSKRTGISRATVTTITADLLRGGLIQEIPRSQASDSPSSSRGRPKVDLKISGDAHLIAGIKVRNDTLSAVLIDFEGRELANIIHPMASARMSARTLAQEMDAVLTRLSQLAGQSVDAITGVGVALSGLVQAETGLVYWSPSLDRRNVAFREEAEAVLERPVFVDNDANLVAIAELTFGKGRQNSDFLVVAVESGIGMGMVIDGRLYRGARGSGGEFGHTKVQIEGAQCRCGQQGCLEAYVGDYAVQHAGVAQNLIPEALSTQDALREIARLAQSGNSAARDIIDQAGRMFAMGLANLVNIFDPERIILAGESLDATHLYSAQVFEAMCRQIVEIDKAPPEVIVHNWGSAMWARGAAAFALEFVQDIAVAELQDA